MHPTFSGVKMLTLLYCAVACFLYILSFAVVLVINQNGCGHKIYCKCFPDRRLYFTCREFSDSIMASFTESLMYLLQVYVSQGCHRSVKRLFLCDMPPEVVNLWLYHYNVMVIKVKSVSLPD